MTSFVSGFGQGGINLCSSGVPTPYLSQFLSTNGDGTGDVQGTGIYATATAEAVKKWRKKTRIRAIESMGGCCVICGYDSCPEALDFHHLDPESKDFSLSSARANPKSWDKIVKELKKCVLICCRCHRELHAGQIELPENFRRFDDSFLSYAPPKEEMDSCPVCQKKKKSRYLTCSKSCAAKRRRLIDWDNFQLLDKLENKSKNAIAKDLGVSWKTVSKHEKRLRLQAEKKIK